MLRESYVYATVDLLHLLDAAGYVPGVRGELLTHAPDQAPSQDVWRGALDADGGYDLVALETGIAAPQGTYNGAA